MSKNALKLKIAYFYPDMLHNFADESNVLTFKKRANWRDIDVQVHEIKKNEKIFSNKYDFMYIGGINDEIIPDVIKCININKEEIAVTAASSVPILGVNCGFQILSKTIQQHNRIILNGLNILDVDFTADNVKYMYNIIGKCDFLENKTIVGFHKRNMITNINERANPFLVINKNFKNTNKDSFEGARSKNTIGTNIIGPIFAQNPHLCDFMIQEALRIKYRCKIPLMQLCDDIEWYSHDYIVESE